MNIVKKVLKLNLPIGKYAVYGSGPMSIRGIRESHDIDLIVTPDLYKDLLISGWQEAGSGDKKHLKTDDIEIFDNWWDFDNYHPNVEQLINDAEMIEGVAFVKLDEVVKWKKAFGREKDLRDVKLIQKYLSSGS